MTSGDRRSDTPLCLAFANTVAVRSSTRLETDLLTSYNSFVSWIGDGGVLGGGDVDRLARRGESEPAAAAEVLSRARRLRDALHATLEALARGRAVEPGDLDLLDREWREARARLRLVRRGSRFAAQFPTGSTTLERPLWMIATSAAELLLSDRLDRLKQCDAPDCTHLFLDTSRNRSRRWCDMALCGNRMKQRRYARRKRGV